MVGSMSQSRSDEGVEPLRAAGLTLTTGDKPMIQNVWFGSEVPPSASGRGAGCRLKTDRATRQYCDAASGPTTDRGHCQDSD